MVGDEVYIWVDDEGTFHASQTLSDKVKAHGRFVVVQSDEDDACITVFDAKDNEVDTER